MQKPSTFPQALASAPFTLNQAEAFGVGKRQLWKRSSIEGVSQGIFRPSDWEFDLASAARSLSAASPGAWISHVTAARLQGLYLPPWLADSNELHLSKPRKLPSVRRRGVIGHTVVIVDSEIEFAHGMWMSTRPRTWLDLARQLPLRELVCVGDQLIRVPRPEFEGRDTPYASISDLRALIARHKNLQGVVRAREALHLMRVGADSVPESLLRLAMLDAGIAEPDLQVRLRPNDPVSPSADLGFRERRVAIQYDGGHHLSEEQIFSDRRRDRAFEAAGWTVLVFGKDCLSDGFTKAIVEIKKALRTGWTDPSVESGFASGR
ncbi:endonuclease domain-containing protein [Paenarthrobacter sp. NPDC089714]|uniref:endonuclease domain-containing protein n=1 Tax=Paenarthrobacter sp. NPDC089714 TaxID=3364377 RepID=UPI003809BBA5